MTTRSRTRTMNPIARSCVWWAVILVVIGTLALSFGTDLFLAVRASTGAGAETGLAVLNFGLALVRNVALPVAAALVGAAVVVQALRPSHLEDDEGLDRA